MVAKNRAFKTIIDDLQEQGATVKRTKAGWHILFPNGGGTSLHLTLSDHRSVRNFRASVRKAGLIWPPDREKSTK